MIFFLYYFYLRFPFHYLLSFYIYIYTAFSRSFSWSLRSSSIDLYSPSPMYLLLNMTSCPCWIVCSVSVVFKSFLWISCKRKGIGLLLLLFLFFSLTDADLTYRNLLTLGRTRKFIPHRGTRGRRGKGLDGTPSPVFLICCSISKRFRFKWKAFDLPNKIFVYLLLEACGVTNNGRHLGSFQWLEIRLKTARNGNFFVLKVAVSRTSAKLGNYKMPVELRET